MKYVDLIKRSNRRTLTLKVDREGKVVVLAPFYYSNEKIEEFVLKKADWIEKHRIETINSNEKYDSSGLSENDEIYLFGEKRIIKFKDIETAEFDDFYMFLPVKWQKSVEKYLIKWLKEYAIVYLGIRLNELSKKLNLSYTDYRITSARTKWGSCSRNGQIMLNFRLLLCKKEVIDYVIMHELTHTKYFNHGKYFYNFLEKAEPRSKEYIKYLKDNAGMLNSF